MKQIDIDYPDIQPQNHDLHNKSDDFSINTDYYVKRNAFKLIGHADIQ